MRERRIQAVLLSQELRQVFRVLHFDFLLRVWLYGGLAYISIHSASGSDLTLMDEARRGLVSFALNEAAAKADNSDWRAEEMVELQSPRCYSGTRRSALLNGQRSNGAAAFQCGGRTVEREETVTSRRTEVQILRRDLHLCVSCLSVPCVSCLFTCSRWDKVCQSFKVHSYKCALIVQSCCIH